jgi:ABC-type branched-subunit amino acid transport system ATPase component/MFS family permease
MSQDSNDGYTRRPSALGGIGAVLRQAVRWDQLARTPYGLLPVLLLAPLFFVRVVQASILGLAGPNISQDLGLDLRVIGGILSIVGFVSIAANLGVGWLADRVPRKPLVAVGALLTAAFSVVQARAVNANTYTVPSVGVDAATSLNFTPAASLLADYYPVDSRGRVFAIIGTAATAGQVLGLVLVGVLVSTYGWRTAVIAVTMPLFIVGIGLFFLKEPVRGYFERKAMGLSEEVSRRPDPPQSFGEAMRTTWSVRTLRRLFYADILGNIGTRPLAILLGFFLADQYGLDINGRTLFLLPTVIASLVGGFLGGGLLDAFSRRAPSSMMRLIAVFNLVSVLGVVFLALQPPLTLLEIVACFFFFGGALTGPGLNAIYSQVIPPSVRSQGLQFNALAALPSLIFFGIFTSIQFSYGWTPTFLLCVPLLVLSAIVTLSAADFFETDRRNASIAATTTEDARRLKAEGKSKLLLCRGVNVFYGGNQVLFGVDLEVEEGEIVALLGTNGAGKSTLLRAISGTQEASDGVIVVDGRDITHMPPHEIAGRGVIHMPGGKGVFPGLTVEENIRLGTWLADATHAGRLVDEAYALFPVLKQRRHQPAGLLSGGEQQMLSLAQAFMARPRLLMIDELSLGLSPAAVGELLEKVKEIHRRGTTVIVVEQSVNVALNLARRAVFMEKGEVRFAGPTSELLRRPDILRSVYVKGTGALTQPGASAAPTGQRRVQADARELLEARDLTKRFGGITALDGVSLKLREGEILGLIGPNGSGKTTLFDIISGYQAPNSGQVIFDGQDVTAMPPHERARRKLIRRFQDARLFPSLTVHESLMVALDQRMEVRNAAMGAMQLPPARRAERLTRARADRLVDLLELGAFRDKFVKELSTGLRRIVDLAFVLATEPKVLLLDEPSSGMAQAEAESLGPLLARVRFETGCSILIIEHDMPLISAVSDELIALVNGSTLTRGSAAEVLNDPRLVEAFLGGSEAAIQRSGNLA